MSRTRPFYFEGRLPVSKSLFIRHAICQSYASNFKASKKDACEDIRSVISGLAALKNKKVIDCGEAATVLRFLALRASREIGTYVITGSRRLMERPHSELKNIFSNLKVKYEFGDQKINIISDGWKNPGAEIFVDRTISSQFASSLLLNSWNLDFPLKISWKGETVSDGYWAMSLAVVLAMGMDVTCKRNSIEILANQKPNGTPIFEPDMSSAFAVAALAAAGGQCRILNFPEESLQPDADFVDVLKAMGVSVSRKKNVLSVVGNENILPIEINLRNSPDMFPVLAVLCAFARGKSRLWGAPHLVYKESNRLNRVFELLEKIGRGFEPLLDGAIIHGKPFDHENDNRFSISYDSGSDHRLVMAACVARQFGFNIRIDSVSAVDKSFPQFKEIIQLW
ncbi:MAG: hypothetical protein A4S09_01120 [Proteobacteria bacterium SG_bin7]|nr:MAG: hypothetical protein A4S09_01120 [Proteobacteria bacterium SG_bin7]